MAGRPLYNLPNATTVESGDKFFIQQGVSSKQVDKDVLLTAENTSWQVGKSVGYSLNDLQGFTEDLYSQAGVTDDGLPDSLGTSQRVEALSKMFGRTFDTLSDVKLSTSLKVNHKVSWGGRYVRSDGGSGWGYVRSGAHVEDGGEIISISPTLYIEQNLKGGKVSIRKFGADPSIDSLTHINKCAIYCAINKNKLSIPIGDFPVSDQIQSYKGVSIGGLGGQGVQNTGGSNIVWNGPETKSVIRVSYPWAEVLDGFATYEKFGVIGVNKGLAAIQFDGTTGSQPRSVPWFKINKVIVNPWDGTDYTTIKDQFLMAFWVDRCFSFEIKNCYAHNCTVGIYHNDIDGTSINIQNNFFSTCGYGLITYSMTSSTITGNSFEGAGVYRIVIGNNAENFSNCIDITGNYLFGAGATASLFIDRDIVGVLVGIDTAQANRLSNALATVGLALPATVNQVHPSGITVKNNLLSGKVFLPRDAAGKIVPECVTMYDNLYSNSSDVPDSRPTLNQLFTNTISGGDEFICAYKYTSQDSDFPEPATAFPASRTEGSFAIAFNHLAPVVLGEFSVGAIDPRFAMLIVELDSYDDSFSAMQVSPIFAKARISYFAGNAYITLLSSLAGTYLYVRNKDTLATVANIGDVSVVATPNQLYELVAVTSFKNMSGTVRAIVSTSSSEARVLV